MIDLSWKPSETGERLFVQISTFLTWLVNVLEKNKIEYHGFMTFDGFEGDEHNYHTMIFAEKDHAIKIIEILQQPPGEYKDKYIAKIPIVEPEPVQEMKEKDDEDDDCDSGVEIEIDEKS